MDKGTHFLGQPMYGQLISLLDKAQILRISQENGGERYVKHFDAWQHLVVMLYAVVKRFDSLREIVVSMLPEARILGYLGINAMPRRSTLSDANLRRNECIFVAIYGELYATSKHVVSADSRRRGCPKWIERLQIIDSANISLFSNLIFKGVGRHPKTGKKKGGIKVHANIMPTSLCPPTFVSLRRPRGIPSCSAPPTTTAAISWPLTELISTMQSLRK